MRNVLKIIIEFTLLFAIYSFIFFLFTFPLILNFYSSFISEPNGDAPQFIWNAFIFKENIQKFKNPFYTDKIFYPLGTGLVMHDYSIIYGLLNLFIKNPIFSINMGIYLSSVFSGLGGYYLSKYFLQNQVLSFINGFIFAFSPFRTNHLLGHYGLIFTLSIPFFILFFVKSFKWNGTYISYLNKKNFFSSILFFLISLISHYYLSYFLIIFIVLYLIFHKRFFCKTKLNKKHILFFLLFWIILNCSLLLLHFLNIFPEESKENLKWSIKYASSLSADLACFLIPFNYSRFFASSRIKDIHSFLIKGLPVENTSFLGYTLLIIFLFYLKKRRYLNFKYPELQFVLFLTLSYFILSIPFVRIFGKLIFILPTAVFHIIPFFNNLRCPVRFTLMLYLFIPILCGSVLKEYIFKNFSHKFSIFFSVCIFLLILIEYFPQRYPLEKYENIPTVYFFLRNNEDGTLLEIPFGIEDAFKTIGKSGRNQMYYQIVHEKKRIGGYISRVNPKIFNFFETDPVLKQLIDLFERGNEINFTRLFSPAEIKLFIKKFDIKYILIYPSYRNSLIERFVLENFKNFISKKIECEKFLLIFINNLK